MAELTFDVNENTQAVEAHPGDSVLLCFAENPTTGYRWSRLGPLPPDLYEGESRFEPDGSGIGAGGRRCFPYRCDGAFRADLIYILSRPWDSQKVEKRISLQFNCVP